VKLGRVVGTVVSTINAPAFDGRTLLLCDLLDPSGAPAGGYVIAVDSVGAGAGETVLLLDEGNSARQVLSAPGAPIRTVVVGIVDAVLEGMPGMSHGARSGQSPGTATVPAAAGPAPVTAPAPARSRRRR
jgi:ethanolamine utilization protein EutN